MIFWKNRLAYRYRVLHVLAKVCDALVGVFSLGLLGSSLETYAVMFTTKRSLKRKI